ncbi:MAG: hypothetical protein IPI84_11765 [Holophagaceae bacterium]|nr:hypothetical protein [Holophagaceae bacterium]
MKALGSACGVIITASHNPKEYNGFKAYNDLGGQVVDPWDAEIEAHMATLPVVPVPPVAPEAGSAPSPGVSKRLSGPGAGPAPGSQAVHPRPDPLHPLPRHGRGLRAGPVRAGRPAPHRQPQPGHPGRYLPHGTPAQP